MKHIEFSSSSQPQIALLIKETALKNYALQKYYLQPYGIDPTKIIAFSLQYNNNNKAPAKMAKEYLAKLLKALDNLKINTLVVCDSIYYKILAGVRKVDGCYGYIKPCAVEGYKHMNVILGANYQGLHYNPDLQAQIDLAMHTAQSNLEGQYEELGNDVIHSAHYPKSEQDIRLALQSLHQYPELMCDIEAFSLKFYETGIATIGFAWDEHNGIAFPVEYASHIYVDSAETHPQYGYRKDNPKIKNLLRKFFREYQGRFVFHNASYDLKVIINDLFMTDLLDQDGMLEGIEIFWKKTDDTKLITYLATNSTAGNTLGLKQLSHEFAGNYGEDVTDIRLIPLDRLLIYNLKDCLCTAYTKYKYEPLMIQDQQQDIYHHIFLPSMANILQMELTGVPIDMDEIPRVEQELLNIQNDALQHITTSQHVMTAEFFLEEAFLEKDFQNRRNKAKFPEKIKPKELTNIDINFNCGSPKQLAVLLYDVLKLPILDKTDTGQPATGTKTLKKLLNHTEDLTAQELIENIIKYTQAAKITSTFIKAFKENSVLKPDGHWYLHGNYNLGGTVSGRLSSSEPNLQNIPSGSLYAKLIKKCFIAPQGWVMCGADFDSLEDRISALTTKDENKLKVYTDGYDGHCLRAFSYFGDQMPDIVDTVESINSIKDKYPKLRQKSKIPTFALTYGGTAYAIMQQAGVPEAVALQIEKNYHELYKASDIWVKQKMRQACRDGYVTVAFGLRVRTPLLAKTRLNRNTTSSRAKAEARTAGNALGQSYGLLNNRAGIEFQKRVLKSEYRNNIKPIMQIHDAMYFIVKNDLDTMKWFNDNLPDCLSWQKLPEIQHPDVKLSGATEIFYPNWANSIDIPNHATRKEIMMICKEAQQTLESA